jgi:hypothetical protein
MLTVNPKLAVGQNKLKSRVENTKIIEPKQYIK